MEGARDRPAALRAASRWCGQELTSIAQWTQAEAIWKAGTSIGTPLPGSIELPAGGTDSWVMTPNGFHWVFTTRYGSLWWSIAVEVAPRIP